MPGPQPVGEGPGRGPVADCRPAEYGDGRLKSPSTLEMDGEKFAETGDRRHRPQWKPGADGKRLA